MLRKRIGGVSGSGWGLGEEFLATVGAALRDIAANPAAYAVIHRDTAIVD
ncbi:MAG: hypothetical protein ACLQVL_24320 [Terriglobia bacterium]